MSAFNLYLDAVSIPSGHPQPFRHDRFSRWLYLFVFQSQTGILNHLDGNAITRTKGYSCKFQSQTGFPSYLDMPYFLLTALQLFLVSIPNGLPKLFSPNHRSMGNL